MKNLITRNILSSVIEKSVTVGSQFFVAMVLIRSLTREEYGALGVMVGYFAFLAVVNISLESIMIRDHAGYDSDLSKYFARFARFNWQKSIILIFISGCVGAGLSFSYQNLNFLFATICLVTVLVADAIVAPLIIYTSVKFKQETVTKLNSLRSCMNLTSLIGLWYFPNLLYWAAKEIIVSVCYISIWFIFAHRYYQIPYTSLFGLVAKTDNFVKNSLLNFSLWTHLNGVVTNFIYRSDTFFLSLFVALTTIGNYNIALNCANIANVLPMILCYQNSVALSHAKDKKEAYQISNMFFRYSIWLGIFTFLPFVLLGKYYIWMMTGDIGVQNTEMSFYMICIVAGLVMVKTFAGPLVSFITIYGSVKSLVLRVSLPVLLLTVFCYYFSAKYYGSYGVAISNIIVSALWLFLLFIDAFRAGYEFPRLRDLSFWGKLHERKN
ncbi:hypothetical protein EG832_00695 [bacterium]|nr:hypothetical protein [bacterium]